MVSVHTLIETKLRDFESLTKMLISSGYICKDITLWSKTFFRREFHRSIEITMQNERIWAWQEYPGHAIHFQSIDSHFYNEGEARNLARHLESSMDSERRAEQKRLEEEGLRRAEEEARQRAEAEERLKVEIEKQRLLEVERKKKLKEDVESVLARLEKPNALITQTGPELKLTTQSSQQSDSRISTNSPSIQPPNSLETIVKEAKRKESENKVKSVIKMLTESHDFYLDKEFEEDQMQQYRLRR